MLSKIGVPELLLILAIAIVIFGAKTLPKLGKAMGETIRNFKQGIAEKGEMEETKEETKKDNTETI